MYLHIRIFFVDYLQVRDHQMMRKNSGPKNVKLNLYIYLFFNEMHEQENAFSLEAAKERLLFAIKNDIHKGYKSPTVKLA